MGEFLFDGAAVQIQPTTNIVLERLPLTDGDTEDFYLHRRVTYRRSAEETDGPFEYTVPPPGPTRFETDLASVPQLLTWLVPKSGRHLPAALVHDALVDDATIDRYQADRLFRDAMGDLGVGFVRRWIMWTAVSLQTILKRGSRLLRAAMIVTIAAVAVLGTLATISLFVDTTLVPWMGSRHWAEELVFGLCGAVVVPALLGLAWHPIKVAGVIAGVAAAVLFHVVVLTTGVYGLYLVLERLPRPAQIGLAVVVAAASGVGFAWGLFG